jgi:hypothetical protein
MIRVPVEKTEPFSCYHVSSIMDPEKHIAEIELLERIFALPDNRGFSASDREAANRRHDESVANSPWFKLWRAYGLPR